VNRHASRYSPRCSGCSNGKYPAPPARDLYFAFLGKPTNPAVVEFVRWVLTDGQKFVPENGYVNLTDEKLAAALARLGA